MVDSEIRRRGTEGEAEGTVTPAVLLAQSQLLLRRKGDADSLALADALRPFIILAEQIETRQPKREG